MPFLTGIPDATLATVGADLTVVDLPPTQLINLFGASRTFEEFDIASPLGDTLTQGDEIAPIDSTGQSLEEGTYLGEATLMNAGATVGLPGVADISLTVNPIEGQVMQDEDGNVFMITDDELSDDRLSVTAAVTVLGIPIEITAPASEITESLASAVESAVPIGGAAIAALIRGGTDTIQATLDTTIITMDFDPDGSFILDDDDVLACFVHGTRIETDCGAIPVQDISVGQMIMTRDHGLRPVRWVGSAKLGPIRLRARPQLRPIRILAGALGQNCPATELLVSPQHRILVRSSIAQRMFGTDEVLVAAKHLLELDGIEIASDLSRVEYFHIMFDDHEIVHSNGAETESFYAGTEALNLVGASARNEIFELFPSLAEQESPLASARILPNGRKARQLATRHARNRKQLVS
ncbi:Hint domain-containing protein [Paracoccus sp. Z330]|uniref:Hint domain-containing protein n=1 Tax=Paracoccus onchidii TaxID=3017813 RepID=A0ABT4ZIT0_9RHOB|nr:Hint domain-containing protein [Paracoccus onchidii]MDB6178635.1 Hint domain-containing protein [Paracoccus onchidii]